MSRPRIDIRAPRPLDPAEIRRTLCPEVSAEAESPRRDRSLYREGLAVFGVLSALTLAVGVAARLLFGF